MIRSSILSVGAANRSKLLLLDSISDEMLAVVNLYIDSLWSKKDFSSKFVSEKVDTWLSARLQQCLGKQALEIVKSQRKKKNRVKPVLKRKSFNLDSRFIDFQSGNHFDLWVRISSVGRRIQLRLPAKAHKHYNKFKNWNRSKSVRLINRGGRWFIEVFFEKQVPKRKSSGKVVGIDCGYKELVRTSADQSFDDGLEHIYEKISRKKQGSKAFKRALIERDSLINKSLNKFDLSEVMELVAEDLKNVKRKSKGRINKKFNNKLQRWSYPKVLRKLQRLAEEAGTLFTLIPPAYTSQKCCKCGTIDKSNRQGKIYQCACGSVIDADLNAAINISHMGVYSPHALC